LAGLFLFGGQAIYDKPVPQPAKDHDFPGGDT